jgi:hypothetical protein
MADLQPNRIVFSDSALLVGGKRTGVSFLAADLVSNVEGQARVTKVPQGNSHRKVGRQLKVVESPLPRLGSRRKRYHGLHHHFVSRIRVGGNVLGGRGTDVGVGVLDEG